MAIVRAPGYFLHRRGFDMGDGGFECWLFLTVLLVIIHNIPLKWDILLPIISIRSDWSPFHFLSLIQYRYLADICTSLYLVLNTDIHFKILFYLMRFI
jgi:hypothetical protein